MTGRVLVSVAAVVGLGAGPATTDDLEGRLEARYRGAWATLATEVYSGCAGSYSNNTMGAAGVTSAAGRRFEPGELVKIDRVKVKRSRVDLLATLSEPVLTSRLDGPFELWDEHECKAQLIFELPRSAVKHRDYEAVTTVIDETLRVHPSRDAALESGDWNGRRRRSYPSDYDRTLAEYEVWKAEQTNAVVAAAVETSVAEATDAAEDFDDDPDYLDGFAAGADELRDIDFGDCGRAVDATFQGTKRWPPSDRGTVWKRGFDDGQRLLFHLKRARFLNRCFVEVPARAVP